MRPDVHDPRHHSHDKRNHSHDKRHHSHDPRPDSPARRRFLTTSGLAAAAAALPVTGARAMFDPSADGFPYEVRRSEAEWRAMLTDAEYLLLRRGRTEVPKSSPLWNETRAGSYACKGCDLHLYDGRWKTVLDLGWAFFEQSEPNALLMGIDRPQNDGTVTEDELDLLARIEVHCRRCGSHHGHIVSVKGDPLHCINGACLAFTPETS